MKTVKLTKIENTRYCEEAYRRLCSTLQFYSSDKRITAITGCLPGEGKSTIAVNLGLALAKSEKRVILVDADFHKSVLAGRYKAAGVNGLSQYLSGQISFDQTAYRTNIENFDIIFSGPVPPNAISLLDSKKYSDMLCTLKERYDYIIVDTPSLTSAMDSVAVSKRCDCAILAVESGAVSRKLIARAKSLLEKSGVNLLGAVLNKYNGPAGISEI